MRDPQPVQNTDRELWREREGDYYADHIFVTQSGAIGIQCGGLAIVRPVREWHELGKTDHPAPPLSVPPQSNPMWEALRWLTNLACGVGEAGGAPESGEWEEAIETAKKELARSVRELGVPAGPPPAGPWYLKESNSLGEFYVVKDKYPVHHGAFSIPATVSLPEAEARAVCEALNRSGSPQSARETPE